jgi:hypothetical protein
MGKIMTNSQFWKVATGLTIFCFCLSVQAQVGSLSEGACWYDFKDTLKVASFNDKSVYEGSRAQIESEIETLLNHKINDMDLVLHCGGYGASLVVKAITDNGTYCVWTKFENGKLVSRSIGSLTDKAAERALCDGHKSGEFILGLTPGSNAKDFMAEMQGTKWSGVIKEVVPVAERVFKVVLLKEYANKDQEIASSLEENFAGKNIIRYIEFNEYHHPVGEYVQVK